jgi:hypothetical protein
LLAVPLAGLTEALAGAGSGAVVHGSFALGSSALAFALRDFGAPRWANWVGSASAAILAAIFALQGVGELTDDERLLHLSYQVLGQRLEASLVDLFIGWCVVTLVADGRTSRVAGVIALAPVLGVHGVALVCAARGHSFEQPPLLKASMLLPFAWLAFESARQLRR